MSRSAAGIAVLLSFFLAVTVYADSAFPPPTNIRITNTSQLTNEEQIWICPTDSNVVLANWRDFRIGFRQIGIGRSTDGGQTWVDSLISRSNQYFGFDSKQSDPTMTVDRLGNYYMSVLDWDAFGFSGFSIIAFYKSTDKGLTWLDPVPNISVLDNTIFEDKQFITTDRTGGIHDGNLYCSWSRFGNPTFSEANRIVFVRSIDGGASFEDTVVVGPPQTSSACGPSVFSAGQFSIPVVTPNGDVHIFWMGTVLDSADCTFSGAIKHVVSTDGGQTFTYEDHVWPVSGYMLAAGGIDTYSMPVADADVSGGPFDGNMYVAFTNIGPEDGSRSDVDFIRSDDNGLTWSYRYQINDDLNSELIDNFHPWLVVNEEGIIVVVFYDERFDSPSYYDFDLNAAYSFDGGKTFTTNHRISDVSSSPDFASSAPRPLPGEGPVLDPVSSITIQAGKLAEYIGVSAHHDKIVAIWTDTRDGNQEAYSANWYLPVLEPRVVFPEEGLYVNSPPQFYWSAAWKLHEDRYRLEIASDPGFTVDPFERVVDTNQFTLDTLPAEGTRYWRAKSLTTTGADSSEYSATRTFIVDTTSPDVPQLLSPADLTITVDSTPAFEWTASVSTPLAPETFLLMISPDSTFPPGPQTFEYPGLTSSQYTIPDPLFDSTRHFWFVMAEDAAGNSSPSDTFVVTYNPDCCTDRTGNVDLTGTIPTEVDLSDLGLMVDFIFNPPGTVVLPCIGEADVDALGGANPTDLSDLGILVDFLFNPPGTVVLPDCP
jgi:hypothetical protein